ncbi:hypothetical protein H9638_02380 [Arthrobacter sp. Sa2BUA2]|uniref:Uncharacterized protein n=1 Tax=Arthrobacter pullicola TaxID=2762224 RepID=A0ABR8YEJ9_9MICC|nr:hypothetical protein [Arthrobacter pullicola]MBD8042651.1 hypothetical protein [Arthrobacter pullicola]
MPGTYVIEAAHDPVVFSDSPDSPAAEFLVEERPRSIRDLYRLGIIHPAIPEEDLHDIQRSLEHSVVPDVVFSEGNHGVVSSRSAEGVAPIPPEAVMTRDVISRAAAMLIARGHPPVLAKLTAEKGARFISPLRDVFPVWREVRFPNLDLEVRGLLVLKRSINALTALNVKFHKHGWIFPESSHFLLTCNEMVGVPGKPWEVPLVLEEMSKPGPHPPIAGYTDRLSVAEISARAEMVTATWR